jgi:hypothetical protein
MMADRANCSSGSVTSDMMAQIKLRFLIWRDWEEKIVVCFE